MAKDVYKAKNEKLVSHINDAFIDLRNSIISQEIFANKNPNEIIDIVEKILAFNKQEKGKERTSYLARCKSKY